MWHNLHIGLTFVKLVFLCAYRETSYRSFYHMKKLKFFAKNKFKNNNVLRKNVLIFVRAKKGRNIFVNPLTKPTVVVTILWLLMHVQSFLYLHTVRCIVLGLLAVYNTLTNYIHKRQYTWIIDSDLSPAENFCGNFTDLGFIPLSAT